jgi:hypothetical protein
MAHERRASERGTAIGARAFNYRLRIANEYPNELVRYRLLS